MRISRRWLNRIAWSLLLAWGVAYALFGVLQYDMFISAGQWGVLFVDGATIIQWDKRGYGPRLSFGGPQEPPNLGLHARVLVGRAPGRLHLIIPFWIYTLPSIVVLIAIGVYARMSKRRASSPLCHRCGYDLTGNVSGRCPECGGAVRQR